MPSKDSNDTSQVELANASTRNQELEATTLTAGESSEAPVDATKHEEIKPLGVPVDFRYKGVGGWLLFFIVTLVLLKPLFQCAALLESRSQWGRLYDAYPGVRIVNSINQAISVALACISIFAGLGLLRIWPQAVRVAKVYLGVLALGTILSLFLPLYAGLPEHFNTAIWQHIPVEMFKALVYPTAWYLYLTKSKRVATTYAPGEPGDRTTNDS